MIYLGDTYCRIHVNHVMQPSENRLGDERGVIDGDAAEFTHHDCLDALSRGAVVAITRQVHQYRDKAAVVIGTQVGLGLPALLEVQHRAGDGQQLPRVRLEELIARVRLEECLEILRTVRTRHELE